MENNACESSLLKCKILHSLFCEFKDAALAKVYCGYKGCHLGRLPCGCTQIPSLLLSAIYLGCMCEVMGSLQETQPLNQINLYSTLVCHF